jgi:dTDP-4-dehydrorhamnose reductase
MNFVETMLKKGRAGDALRVVNDQRLTPTSTRELARKLAELIETDHYGLYHITANGDCTWYEFAREIFTIMRMDINLAPTIQKEYRAPAMRPAYSVLRNSHLQQLGMDDLKDWRDALRDYLAIR